MISEFCLRFTTATRIQGLAAKANRFWNTREKDPKFIASA